MDIKLDVFPSIRVDQEISKIKMEFDKIQIELKRSNNHLEEEINKLHKDISRQGDQIQTSLYPALTRIETQLAALQGQQAILSANYTASANNLSNMNQNQSTSANIQGMKSSPSHIQSQSILTDNSKEINTLKAQIQQLQSTVAALEAQVRMERQAREELQTNLSAVELRQAAMEKQIADLLSSGGI